MTSFLLRWLFSLLWNDGKMVVWIWILLVEILKRLCKVVLFVWTFCSWHLSTSQEWNFSLGMNLKQPQVGREVYSLYPDVNNTSVKTSCNSLSKKSDRFVANKLWFTSAIIVKVVWKKSTSLFSSKTYLMRKHNQLLKTKFCKI